MIIGAFYKVGDLIYEVCQGVDNTVNYNVYDKKGKFLLWGDARHFPSVPTKELTPNRRVKRTSIAQKTS